MRCSVTNRGGAIFVSRRPNPVHVAYRWRACGREESIADDGLRTALPRSLAPAQTVDLSVSVQAPQAPGRHLLTIALVQEFVAWFDAIDRAGGCTSPDVVE